MLLKLNSGNFVIKPALSQYCMGNVMFVKMWGLKDCFCNVYLISCYDRLPLYCGQVPWSLFWWFLQPMVINLHNARPAVLHCTWGHPQPRASKACWSKEWGKYYSLFLYPLRVFYYKKNILFYVGFQNMPILKRPNMLWILVFYNKMTNT